MQARGRALRDARVANDLEGEKENSAQTSKEVETSISTMALRYYCEWWVGFSIIAAV